MDRDIGCAEKQKRKNIFFFFFPSQNVSYPTAVLRMHWYTYVLRVCTVCYIEGRDISTLSRMRFSTEQTPFIERYFFASKNSFLLMTVYARIFSFLCRLREASTVLSKSKLFPLVQGDLSPETHPMLLLQAQCILLSRIAVCSLIFQ